MVDRGPELRDRFFARRGRRVRRRGFAVVAIPRRPDRGRLRLCCLLLSGLAACSPYNFSQEIGAVSTGVDQLSDGFTSGYAALAADRAAKVQLELTGARPRVAMASSCLVPPSKSLQDGVPCG